MFLATLDWPTSKPSLSSSPWMRGAPHSGLSALIRRISARRSASICGRPPADRDFQRQYRRKLARCQRCLGPNDGDCLQDRWKLPIQLNEEQPIAFCEFQATSHLPPQHSQLMPERCVLRLKSALQLERRGEQRKQEA